MMEAQGAVMWAARMGLVSLGGALTARGVGDAPLWEAVTGALLALLGAVWSWRARKAQIAMEPR